MTEPLATGSIRQCGYENVYLDGLDFDLFGLFLNIAIENADGETVAEGGNHAGGVGIRGRDQDRTGRQATQSLAAVFGDEGRDGAGESIGRDGHKRRSLEECARLVWVEQRVVSGRRVMETNTLFGGAAL